MGVPAQLCPHLSAKRAQTSPTAAQDFSPRIHLSEEDFLVMTRGGGLLDEEGMLRMGAFEEVMREQVRPPPGSGEPLSVWTRRV